MVISEDTEVQASVSGGNIINSYNQFSADLGAVSMVSSGIMRDALIPFPLVLTVCVAQVKSALGTLCWQSFKKLPIGWKKQKNTKLKISSVMNTPAGV